MRLRVVERLVFFFFFLLFLLLLLLFFFFFFSPSSSPFFSSFSSSIPLLLLVLLIYFPFIFLSFIHPIHTTISQTSQSYFLVDTTGYNIDTNDEGTWPQTLFFERRNIWLEQTSADLKSQGILAGDILELKSKPKLVRVFIGNRSKMLKYMPTTLVQNVIEELWKGSDDRNEKEDVCDFGIFLSHDGKRFEEAGEGLWLANDKRLASYNLNFNDSLYFSKLPEQQRRKKSLGGFFFFFFFWFLFLFLFFLFIYLFIYLFICICLFIH